jgi:predicted AAA+ superfamily ATPase
MNNNICYAEQLNSLSVFRGILKDNVVKKLLILLTEKTIAAYGDFVHELYNYTDNLTEYLLNAVLEDENNYMLRLATMQEIPDVVNKAAHNELCLLQNISRITPDTVKKLAGIDLELAEWNVSELNFIKIYAERMSQLQTKGYGIFAKYHAFVLKDGVIAPVKAPDNQKLSQLEGYENERRKVIDNTLALLSGKPAANALLYGDAGTGKSSTVKAVANEYKDMGLRLIELKKSQLHELPAVIESIAKNPLKFIIFIDDLSFSYDDNDFGALKAVLEGSVTSKTPNLVIYATSNRRHLVKEKFSDRDGDDIHANDSREELTSLSERFGLKVTFVKPDKTLYIQIVTSLAKQYGIECNEALFQKAEMYALRRNGRSGRAARQFIESVKAGLI